MENQKLVELLRSDHDCDTCGFMDCKHDICLMDAMAADAIENLQTENAALRRATDALTDAQAVMVKEFTEKLEELAQVKAERDEVLALIRGNCSYCKHWLNVGLNKDDPCLKCVHFAVRERIKGDFWEFCGLRKE